MFSVGNDLEEISRFTRLIEKQSFFHGVFTAYERDYIKNARIPAATAAGFFCAKEAVAKAVGEGLFGLHPAHIEIYHAESGAPQVRLLSRAAERYGHVALAISISHAGQYAAAVCMAQWE